MVIILYWITRLFYIYSSFAPLHLLVNAKYRISNINRKEKKLDFQTEFWFQISLCFLQLIHFVRSHNLPDWSPSLPITTFKGPLLTFESAKYIGTFLVIYTTLSWRTLEIQETMKLHCDRICFNCKRISNKNGRYLVTNLAIKLISRILMTTLCLILNIRWMMNLAVDI